jgi:hypothetical protein
VIYLQARVRDYVAVLNLELVLDEAEGYAFLRSRPEPDDGRRRACRGWSRGGRCRFRSACCWRCCARSWPSSTPAAATRAWCSARDEVAELMRVFLPEGSNEARLIDQIDFHLGKVVELGFLRRLKPAALDSRRWSRCGASSRPFVDAQWLAEFDQRLAGYRALLAGQQGADR